MSAPDGREIVMHVTAHSNETRIAVIDPGVDIPPYALPHLFGRFYRVQTSLERVPGLGLGLYISH